MDGSQIAATAAGEFADTASAGTSAGGKPAAHPPTKQHIVTVLGAVPLDDARTQTSCAPAPAASWEAGMHWPELQLPVFQQLHRAMQRANALYPG